LNFKKTLVSQLDIRVRKAEKKDFDAIYSIAASVGTGNKDSYKGFLMDNYLKEPEKYKEFFKKRLDELEYFYIAEENRPLGFLMGYKKSQWLKYNPNWLEDIYWSPDFDMSKTEDFIVVDKTAILAGYSGQGIGSILYKSLLHDLKRDGINNIFAETIVNPVPNFASLAFRKKQNYSLAGMRYEKYKGTIYTTLVYHKPVY